MACRTHKIVRMTLLVGMIGTDGIVFAADELLVGEAQQGTQYNDRVFIQKIQHSRTHRVVFAGVGDDTTRRVEDRLLSVLDEGFDFKNVKRSLERITKDALKSVREKAEPEPPNRSSTQSPPLLLFTSARSISSTGFMVGCRRLAAGFFSCHSVDCDLSPYQASLWRARWQ